MSKVHLATIILVKVSSAISCFSYGVLNQYGTNLDEELPTFVQDFQKIYSSSAYASRRHDVLGFPLIGSYKIDSKQCHGFRPNDIGTCMKRHECKKSLGKETSSCAYGYGTCCVRSLYCSGNLQQDSYVVTKNLTHLLPDDKHFRERCRFEIPKYKKISQVRLDFLQFEIEEGEEITEYGLGNCKEDTFMISGAENIEKFTGPLCGNLTGQHMYLEFGNNDKIFIDIYRKTHLLQHWDILVSFISSKSPELAPKGCLQYYREIRGRVTSFNFNSLRQLNNQEYSICIDRHHGMNAITWKICGNSHAWDFVMTGQRPRPPTGFNPRNGTFCQTDYVMIPNINKYCGNTFPDSVTSNISASFKGISRLVSKDEL